MFLINMREEFIERGSIVAGECPKHSTGCEVTSNDANERGQECKEEKTE